eukprot:CAMPEP_0202727984 /NCGR_PEP_ID=MMETSP1385-20130828/185396_1 /ASSEMBLY_ACC=CAM_ASM_000861 /TAXON_ID=933848 /ORGANISM="Elphidium margaritaceum" /LENGTH=406 /DNA_ID=CAMNT_0049394229 /DNA_START=47 /DNA_END=1267 /DNA_ORIENTATION=+
MGATESSDTVEISVSDPSGLEYDIQFDSEPFAEGKHRQCYTGVLSNPNSSKHNKKVVLKVFKSHHVQEHGANYECVKDLERSIICHEHCVAFDRAMQAHSDYTIRIYFVAPLRINIKTPSNRSVKQLQKALRKKLNGIPIHNVPKYLTCQMYLTGLSEQNNYQKFTSNNGWTAINSDYQFLSAFSHFSWAKSKGKLLITGLQGVQRRALFLSDATIHSDHMRQKGSTDLGVIGMVNFFLNHQCSDLCKHLPVPNTTLLMEHFSECALLKVEKSAFYAFEFETDIIAKVDENLRAAYNESLHDIFKCVKTETKTHHETAAAVNNDGGAKISSDTAQPDRIERIEHVIEGVDEAQAIRNRDDDEMEVIVNHLNISWFGDAEYSTDPDEAVDQVPEADHEHETNEWELI